MKTYHSKLITAGLAAAMMSPALALEGPADDAPPPPAAAQESTALPQFKLQPNKQAEANGKEAPKEQMAFLGIVTGEVPKQLADHLELKNGEGVIVQAISPDSPASNAGIAVNDVITAVGGQPIGSQQDLSHQITKNTPGAKVDLSVIHKGKPAIMGVTLGVRPAEIAANEPPTVEQLDLDRLPKDMADHIRKALGGKGMKLGGGGDELPQQMEDSIRELENRMRAGQPLLEDVAPPAARNNVTSSGTLRMKDNDGSIELKSQNGAKEATVRDLDDKVVWSGPWNNDNDRAAAPEDIRKRMDTLNLDMNFKGGGIRLNFNRGGALKIPNP